MKNLIKRLKNLFAKKTEVSNVEVCKDVFGTPIHEYDNAVPITYNEFVRCGYSTVRSDYTPILGKNLSKCNIKCGVIKETDFLSGLNGGWGLRVKYSKRKGFIHVYAPLNKVLPEYRYRTI